MDRNKHKATVDGVLRDRQKLRSRTTLVTGLAPGLPGALDPDDLARTPWSYRPRTEVWEAICEHQFDIKNPIETLDEACELYFIVMKLGDLAHKNSTTPIGMIMEFIDKNLNKTIKNN